MTIVVEMVVTEMNDKLSICGKTDIGPIAGIWRSFDIKPVVGTKYDCELFLPYIDSDEITARQEPLSPSYTEIGIDGKVYFKGLCEAIEDDSFVVSFGSDWIECFEISGLKVKLYDSILFSIEKNEIDIYPLELIGEGY